MTVLKKHLTPLGKKGSISKHASKSVGSRPMGPGGQGPSMNQYAKPNLAAPPTPGPPGVGGIGGMSTPGGGLGASSSASPPPSAASNDGM